jgi:MFS superfamily sulfate permease-like transporter
VTDLDTTAADVLRELDEELAAGGVDLRFAEMKSPVQDRLVRYGLLERFGTNHFYPTIGVAVSAYLEATGIEWTDWEERVSPGPSPRQSPTA